MSEKWDGISIIRQLQAQRQGQSQQGSYAGNTGYGSQRLPSQEAYTNLAPPSEEEDGAGFDISQIGKNYWDSVEKESWLYGGVEKLALAGYQAVAGGDKADKLKRKMLDARWQEKYDYTLNEAFDFIQTGTVPEAVKRGEADTKLMEEAAIEEQGGMLKATVNAIKENPGEMVKGLAKAIAIDPWMLMLPETYGAIANRALSAMGTASKGARAGAKAAGVAGVTAAGSGMVAGGEAIQSSRETGEVDMDRVGKGAMLGAAISFPIGVAQATFQSLKRAGDLVLNKAGTIPEETMAQIVAYAKKNKVSLQTATTRIMEANGVDPRLVVNEMNLAVQRMTKELGGDGRFVGPPTRRQAAVTAARAETGAAGRRATALQKYENDLNASISDAIHKQHLTSQEPPSQWAWRQAGERAAEKTSQVLPEEELTKRITMKIPSSHPRTQSIADDLYNSAAFAGNSGNKPITKAIMTLQEFTDTPMGQSKTGKPLQGASLQARYTQFHRDLIRANRDPAMHVTKSELEDIMSTNSKTMRDFMLTQARRQGARPNQIPKKFRGQAGEIDPKLRNYMGWGSAAGVAALIGYAKEQDINDAWTYALLVGGVALGAKVMKQVFKSHPALQRLGEAKRALPLNHLYNRWQGEGAVLERQLISTQHRWWDMTGGKYAGVKLRNRITEAIERGEVGLLPAVSKVGKDTVYPRMVAQEAVAMMKGSRDKMLKMGVIAEDDVIKNYVQHFWTHPSRSTDKVLDDLFGNQPAHIAFQSAAEKSRVIPTYSRGKKLGLIPRTEDIADIVPMHIKAVEKAARTRDLYDSLLKIEKDPITGLKLIMPAGKAPTTYKAVSHRKFTGKMVHPDLAPAIDSMFGSGDFSAPMRGALALNFLLKRNAVSLSLFHAKALLGSALMAGGLEKVVNPLKWKQGTQHVVGIFTNNKHKAFQSPALAMLRSQSKGMADEIDRLLRNGLILQKVDDVGNDIFYNSLRDMSGALDSVSNKFFKYPAMAGAKGIRGIERMNRLVDGLMWDRIFVGFKLQTALDQSAKLAKRYPNMSRDEIARVVSEFANDAYGGLNWARLANNVENKYGNMIANQMASVGGRAKMQLGAFAPDWTTANARVIGKAFVNKNPISQKLHMQYAARGTMLFAVGANAWNLINTGHNIWENENGRFDTVDLGNGTRISISKQFWEPAKTLIDPAQTIINKMGILPATTSQILTGKEWLSSEGKSAPNITEEGENAFWQTTKHVGKKFAPIFAQQAIQQGDVSTAVSGALGFPTYKTGKGEGSGGRTRSTSRTRSSSRTRNKSRTR